MPARRSFLSLKVALVLVVGLVAWGMLLASAPQSAAPSGVVRQKKDDKKKKRTEEEEDDKKADEKKAEGKPKAKKRGEEEDEKPVKPGVGKLADEADKGVAIKATGDLAALAKATRHPDLKRLFGILQVEHDELILKRSKGVTSSGTATVGRIRVKPLPQYIPDLADFKGSLSYSILNDSGDTAKEESVSVGRIQSIRYYEQIAIDEVKEFKRQRFTGFAVSNPKYLSRYDQLTAAEQALSHVLRFHQSARETEQRKGDGWDEVEKQVRTELLDVLLKKMSELRENKNFNMAFEEVRKMLDTFTRPGDHKKIAGPLADLLRQAIQSSDFSPEQFKEARARLKFIEDQFPNSEILQPIRESLQGQAKMHFKRAQQSWKDGEKAKASAALAQAEETWPELDGLRSFRIQIDQEYQVLQVGVRALPQYLSPGWAHTDSELRAVELLFESLVTLTPDDQGAMYYRPSFAEGRPRVIHLGREFKLPRNARWSDNQPIGAADLRFTVKLMQEGKLVGRSPAWGEMLGDLRHGSDPFRVQVSLRQGLLEPLAAMSFKILPRRTGIENPTERAFALEPKISSGPFVYKRQHSDVATKRLYASFEANPYYGVRADKLNLPRIREVRLFPVLDPVSDLRQRNLDLALDLTSEQAAELAKDRDFEVPMPTARTMNRRIYFLAVNHQHACLANPDVRIALARAVAREPLLDEHFRKGLGKQVHKAINGPYPAGSWACNPKLTSRTDKDSLDPFDDDLARSRLKEGLEKVGQKNPKLTLKYPAGDKVLDEAMAALCKQVMQVLPDVVLTPEPRPAADLRTEVEETHNYQLAYYHHDFADETFWLLPLLGPMGRGGAGNFLHYTGPLVAKVQSVDARRDFSQVREHVQSIHRQFLDFEMPFIPLWQLDPLYAYRRGVIEDMPAIDPQLIFTRVEEWRVKRNGGGG